MKELTEIPRLPNLDEFPYSLLLPFVFPIYLFFPEVRMGFQLPLVPLHVPLEHVSFVLLLPLQAEHHCLLIRQGVKGMRERVE
jgi:hypothetical protein